MLHKKREHGCLQGCLRTCLAIAKLKKICQVLRD